MCRRRLRSFSQIALHPSHLICSCSLFAVRRVRRASQRRATAIGDARILFTNGTGKAQIHDVVRPVLAGRRTDKKREEMAFFIFSAQHRHLTSESMKSDSLGQLILTGVPARRLDPETEKLFRRIQPGGFILFTRNIESAAQLRKLTDDLRSLSVVEPIIKIDQEGGRVSRLRLIGNEPPNAQQLRDANDVDLIRRHGDITGRLLRLFGFNLDLCPVLDISFDDDAENSLHGRCYGKDVEQVFRRFVRDVDSMMICHAWYPCFESQPTPATVSCRIVTELLRNEFGFDGLIMTDDLDMGAILTAYRLDDTIRLCLEAGNDIMMLCHRVPEIETVHRILGALPSDQIERAQQHVDNFKKSLSPPQKFSESAFQEINTEIADLRTVVVGEEKAGRVVTERQISPVERF